MNKKDAVKEKDLFARHLHEKKKRIEKEIMGMLIGAERKRLKKIRCVNLVKCPKCGMRMLETDYSGVRVDICDTCEGVWLDGGELDTIVNKEKVALMDTLFSVSVR